jgi:hypothetical protein
MISAKLVTNKGIYNLDIAGCPTMDDGLKHIKYTLEGERTFYGNHDIIYLGDDVVVSVIKITDDADVEVAPAGQGEPVEALGLSYSQHRITFLGLSLMVRCAEYSTPGNTYLIVTAINGENPFNILNAGNVAKLTVQVGTLAYSSQENYTVVAPPTQLEDEAEYVDYLTDYVKEELAAQEATGSKTGDAKAWKGWKGDGNE